MTGFIRIRRIHRTCTAAADPACKYRRKSHGSADPGNWDDPQASKHDWVLLASARGEIEAREKWRAGTFGLGKPFQVVGTDQGAHPSSHIPSNPHGSKRKKEEGGLPGTFWGGGRVSRTIRNALYVVRLFKYLSFEALRVTGLGGQPPLSSFVFLAPSLATPCFPPPPLFPTLSLSLSPHLARVFSLPHVHIICPSATHPPFFSRCLPPNRG